MSPVMNKEASEFNLDLSCLEEDAYENGLPNQPVSREAHEQETDPKDGVPTGEVAGSSAGSSALEKQSVNPTLTDPEADNLRIILQVYYHQFKQDLAVIAKDLSSESLLMKGVAELKELRRKCDMLLGAASASQNKKKLFNSLIYIIEKLGTTSDALIAGVNLKGLTGAAIADKDFQKDLCRLSLKHLSAREVEPEVSAGMRLISLIMQVNHNNTVNEIGAISVAKKPVANAALPLNNSNNTKVSSISKANELFKDL